MKFESSCWIFLLVLIILFVLFNQCSLKEELTPNESSNVTSHDLNTYMSYLGF